MTGFWVFMLLLDVLIPLTMIGFGKRFRDKPPEKINALFGYRTTRSMKNADTWRFAHQYCGNLWFRWGAGLLPFSILPLLLVFGKDASAVGAVGGIICMVQLIPLVGVILPTERALKKTFDHNGMRRKP
jgi:uncharacterized membrane protein